MRKLKEYGGKMKILGGINSKLQVYGSLIWRYKYIIGAVVLVLGVIGAFVFYSKSIDTKWNKGMDSYRRADYDNAAKYFNGLALPTGDAERLNAYAQTMLATQQLDKAAVAYKELYAQKKDPLIKLLLGNVYNQQKKHEEAEKIYNEIITSNANYIQAYVNLSTMHKLRGDNKKALEVAELGVKNNPDNVVLLELLVSMALSDKNSTTYKEAVSRLKKVNPKDPLLESLRETKQ